MTQYFAKNENFYSIVFIQKLGQRLGSVRDCRGNPFFGLVCHCEARSNLTRPKKDWNKSPVRSSPRRARKTPKKNCHEFLRCCMAEPLVGARALSPQKQISVQRLRITVVIQYQDIKISS